MTRNDAFVDDGDDSVESVSDSHEESAKEEARDNKASIDQTLAREETNALRCLRFLVLAILLAAATFASVAVYIYMKQDEEEEFEENFYDLAFRLGMFH